MEKTVGIITILKVNNYGAELQAYATQEVLNLMGYKAEIIDYLFYKNVEHIRERCSMPFYPYPLKNRIKEWGLWTKDKVMSFKQSKIVKKRGLNFEQFHNKYNRFSAKRYRKFSELYKNPPVYDVYCVGSDQVWNPRCYTNLKPYYLTFAPQTAVKFSYASSFGVSILPDAAKSEYKLCLQNLDAISVREMAGVKIVSDLIGKKAQLVADPTLLLNEEEWAKVEQPVENLPKRYVLVYELHPIKKIMELAGKIADKKGIKIVRLCKDAEDMSRLPNVLNITEAGPSEFIYLFRHAESIVTNSFHGTAFSINFHKNFYCVLSNSQTNNGRQLSLLELCGLKDCVIYEDELLPEVDSLQIDYKVVRKNLDAFIEESKQYIRRAIDGK